MRRHIKAAALVAAATVAATAAGTAGTAVAARPEATVLVGGLPLAPGEIGAGIAPTSRLSVSADGRWVAFVSELDGLSRHADPDSPNVFRKDRRSGRVTFVSRATGASGAAGTGTAANPVISDDGRRIAWSTTAALDPADTDGGMTDVYVRDLAAKTTTLASVGAGGAQVTAEVGDFDFSGDGRHVAFTTVQSLDPVDVNRAVDVYRRDLTAAATALVTRDAAGADANDDSDQPSISADGRHVAFRSYATDLVGGFVAVDSARQLYVRDMAATTAANTLVTNHAGAPLTGAIGDSRDARVAVDGAGVVHVAFTSRSNDLDTPSGGFPGGTWQVFSHDLSQPSSQSITGGPYDYGLHSVNAEVDAISADGRKVVFSAEFGELGDPPNYWNVYVHDAATGTRTRVSAGPGPGEFEADGAISDDGSTVVWFSQNPLVPDLDPGFQAVYARSYPAGTVELVSRPRRPGALRTPALPASLAASGAHALSADGRYVVLTVRRSGSPFGLVYRRDTWTGALEPVARETGAAGALATAASGDPSISADGARVAFSTYASLDPADGDSIESVYVRDLVAQTTTLASRADGAAGAAADRAASAPQLSGDGQHVTFYTAATNLAGTALYVRDLAAGRTTAVSRADGPAGALATGFVRSHSISDDGTVIAFETNAALDPDDPTTWDEDVYVRDTVAGTTRIATRQTGAAGAKGRGRGPSISGDGNVVVFVSVDETIAPEAGSWNGVPQAVARDLTTNQTTLVSRLPGGAPANAEVDVVSADGDGSTLAFSSKATNLLPDRGGARRKAVFARESASGALSGPLAFGRLDVDAVQGAGEPSLSASGRCLAFGALGHNADQRSAAGDIRTAYVYALPAAGARAPRCRAQR